MRPTIKTFTILIISFLLYGCVKQNPQLPANKSLNIDSTQMTLQRANEILITHEDSILSNYVDSFMEHNNNNNNNNSQYKKDENGFWYLIFKNSHEKHRWRNAQVEYKVYSLSDELYFSQTEAIQFGKNQLIPTLDELVKKMSPGDSAIAIAPWYLAYGLKGNERIPPYTSLKISLHLLAE